VRSEVILLGQAPWRGSARRPHGHGERARSALSGRLGGLAALALGLGGWILAGSVFRAVVEATGAAGGLALASDLCAIGATLGILGYHQSGGGERTVPMESWNFRALKVLSLHHRDPANVLRWIDRAQRSAARGGIVPSALVDAQLPLDDAPLGLRAVPASEAPVKAVLVLS